MSGVGVKTSGGWWGAKGCGLVVGLGVVMALALATGWVVTLRPLHEAVEAREALAELYGTQDEFTPPAHGAVPAERMEAFLAVREQLAGSCARLTESRSTIDSVEDFEWVDQPKKREELFESPWSRGLAAIGLELRRGEFWRARNEALLDAGMGLGEYSYLFVLAYSSHLVPDQEGTGGIANGHVNVLTRVRRLLLETLRRQLAAVEAGATGPSDDAWVEELSDEVARLEQDPSRIPWMDGLPARVEVSIAPYRERLDAALCEATLRLELIRNEKNGVRIHGH